jgi:integrase
MRGNITRRGKSSWRLKFDVGVDERGRRRIRYATVKGKRADAEAELARLLNDANRGMLIDATKITVADHMAAWLKDKELSGATRESYEMIVRAFIVPALGAIELQKLKPKAVKDWIGDLRQGPRGRRRASTVANALRILSAGLDEAVKLDLVARNVAANVEPPKREDREVQILKRADDIRAVLEALSDSDIYPIVVLALSTGARRSEVLALRWCDVDLDHGAVRIEHSLEQTKGGLRLKAPKTKAGRRPIQLPALAVDVLNQHRKAQLELRLKLGMGKPDPEAFVFGNHDGSPLSPNNFSVTWRRVVEKAGLPRVTFHSLRHSHASALIRAGLDVVRVSRQLGHSKPTIILSIYAHEFEEADSGAADAIGKVLG